MLLLTVVEAKDTDDRHRLAFRRVTIPPTGTKYVVVVGSALEPTDEELESLREILGYVVPIALVVAGFGGWFLARQSLSPVVAMAERARKIGVENLSGRLPVANPRDELGRLAETFNELLGRLEASLTQQRQFMADASHELRTPVATARTAASVALQQPHRDERDYRETLEIIEQQTVRLSRIVDDMFTLARADAGNYPVHTTPMYLDEVVDDVVRAARVLASPKDVSIEPVTIPSAVFNGDEDLIRRLIVNLLDNADPARAARAARCAPSSSRPPTGMPSRSAIRGRASRQRFSRTSSSGSIAGMPRAGAGSRTVAPGWASRWRAGSPTSTAGTSSLARVVTGRNHLHRLASAPRLS